MIHVGMLLFPKLTQLDLTAPFEVFSRWPDAQVHLLWKDLAPVKADSSLGLLPSCTLVECPKLDVLFVPGGAGQVELMNDEEVLAFLRHQGQQASWVTSVCTGSLVLGRAGLLDGYNATSHWAYTELLALFGARFTEGRVVIDRNRVTAGGVTAGIDFALTLTARLYGEELARRIQLTLEYDPVPPFQSGHPRNARPEDVAELIANRFRPRVSLQREVVEAHKSA